MILRQAITNVKEGNWQPQSRFKENIEYIILGNHLTFRYILLNGLLAKSTNPICNPLCLQAGSSLSGAFDARSLCHKVVVPVERSELESRLGGSNEPFLNKPARFTEISTKNAKRRGEDTLRLKALITVLGDLKSADEAKKGLQDAIYFTLQRPSRNILDYLSGSTSTARSSSITRFGQKLIEESMEGESCAILSGVSFEFLGDLISKTLDVKVHPVNQAGSSSHEVSDVDVFFQGEIIYTAEVKDKAFYAQDIEHAVSKVAVSGGKQIIFLLGPRGKLIDWNTSDAQDHWREKGFSLLFIDVISFFTSIISLTSDLSMDTLISYIDKHAKIARIKDVTYKHINDTLSSVDS
jgi:hypothetical protein